MNIKPIVTLYHYDLPYELEKKGGWTNRDTVKHFKDYAEVCFKNFGDKVSKCKLLNKDNNKITEQSYKGKVRNS